MRNVASSNARSSRPVLHLSISFHQEEKLKIETRDIIFTRILEELGASWDNHQFVIAQHFDASHEHYHILLNKVGLDRTNINTSYIKNKCQVIADKLEQELDLRRTYGRTVVYDPTSEKGFRYTKEEERNVKTKFSDKADNVRSVKEFLRTTILRLMDDGLVKNVSELVGALKQQGIETETKFDQAVLKGISFRYKNQAYKGTQLRLKSKQIQNHFDNKSKNQHLIGHKKEETLEEVSWKEEIENSIKASENKQRELEKFLKSYKAVITKIIERIKNEEDDAEELLSEFTKGESDFNENQNYFEKFEFLISDERRWILKKINIVQSSRKEYEKELLEYKKVQEAAYHEISFFMLPGKRKLLQEQNERLRKEKKRFKEPKLEIWGLEGEGHFQNAINLEINQEIDNQRKLRLEKQKKQAEENQRILEEQSKEKLSLEDIKVYKNNRMQYANEEDYIQNFLTNYEHDWELKDLFWLDKKFYSLETENERARYLQYEFGLSDKAAYSLASYFFEAEEKVLEMKIECLNRLPDRLIRGKDEIPTQDRSQQNYLSR